MASSAFIRQHLQDARREERDGWILLRQEGAPFDLGFQNGYLLASEIEDELRRLILYSRTACPGYDWSLFRKAADELYWPRLDAEWREEIEGTVEGLTARGVAPDLTDIVAYNGFLDTFYSYHPWLLYGEKPPKDIPKAEERGGCSAFVATGSYTRDHRPVLAHSTWLAYVTAGWNVLRSVFPATGYPFVAQSNPGNIHSGTDFYMNAEGLAATNTTMTGAYMFRPEGRPNFARSREAIQYSSSIQEWARRMSQDSNSGVPSDWLLIDAKSGEIGQLELGTNALVLEIKSDGYFAGSNMAFHAAVRQETSFDYNDAASSPCARQQRWQQLLEERRGTIDAAAAREFLADHVDVRSGEVHPSRTTLCGHVETEPTGLIEWGWGSLYPGGGLDGKVVDAKGLDAGGQFSARYGKPCDATFSAQEHLMLTREYAWELELPNFRLEPHAWVEFRGL